MAKPAITLRELIACTGLRHGFIAAQIGASATDFSGFLTGRRNLRVEKIEKLAALIGSSVEELSLANCQEQQRRAEKLKQRKAECLTTTPPPPPPRQRAISPTLPPCESGIAKP